MAKDKNTTPLLKAHEGDLGSLLQEYREKAGYSLPQMADALCLSEDTLVNLEDENFQALPVPPYVRGYLRNYASFAEENPDELISRYESLRGATPGELEHRFKTTSTIFTSSNNKKLSPVIIQVLFLALLLGIIAGIMMIPSVNNWIKTTWDSFSNQSTAHISSDNPLLTGTMPVPTPLPLDEETKNDNTESNTADTNSNKDTNKDKPVTDTAKPTTIDKTTEKIQEIEKATEEKKPVVNDETAEPSSGDAINIKLVFNKEVWMRIRDKSNKTVFEGQNRAGNEKTLKLNKPLTFRIGNAQGLSLFVDGKAVDISSYINGSIANFTLE